MAWWRHYEKQLQVCCAWAACAESSMSLSFFLFFYVSANAREEVWLQTGIYMHAGILILRADLVSERAASAHRKSSSGCVAGIAMLMIVIRTEKKPSVKGKL